MAITIAVPNQNIIVSGSYTSSTLTIGTGLMLMASIVHDRDTVISSITWDGNPLSAVNDFSHPDFGYKSLSVFALYNFIQGAKVFQCSIPGTSNFGVSILSFNNVGATYNPEYGISNTSFLTKTINKNIPTDSAFLVAGAASDMSYIGSSGSIAFTYGLQMQGQYGAQSGSSTLLAQYMSSTVNVTWVSFVLQEYIAPPPSQIFSPIWLY